MLIADIPGLIEGASKGRGLGDEFLRHTERTAVLIHCIDAYSNSIVGDYKTIRKELEAYSEELAGRPEIIALTKIEGLDDDIVAMQIAELEKAAKKKVYPISAPAHKGLKPLLEAAFSFVDAMRTATKQEKADELVVISPDFKELEWSIELLDEDFVVIGRKIERFALRTDTESEEGVRRLKDILRKKGVEHALKRRGIQRGQKIYFGVKKQICIEY